jgi:nucleoside-diphosphate-sugar epimerase
MITGGTGFIGLNVAEALLRRGDHVVVVALDDVPVSAKKVFSELPGKLTEVRGDIRDVTDLTKLMRQHQVRALLPFAAVTSGDEREADEPERIIEINLLGLVGQMRAARDAGVRKLIAPASGAVYGLSYFDRPVLDEATTPCVPMNIYGMTKYAVERTALRLGALWSLDVVVARIGGTFGPWERDTGVRDLLTPYWLLALHAREGQEAVLPKEIPPYGWVYSRDVADALVHLLDANSPLYRVFNVSCGIEWSPLIVGWAEELARAYPGFGWRQSENPAEINVRLPDTRPRAWMDVSRITETGWRSRYPPQAAYEDYSRWLLAHPDALDN